MTDPTATAATRWDGKLFRSGSWLPGLGTETLASQEKSTSRTLASQALATEADVDAAVTAATTAQPGWAAAGYDVRAGLLRRVARLLEDRADDYVDWLIRETGGIRGKAEYEVGAACNELYEAAALTSHATAEVLPSHNTGKLNLVQRVPVGVVAAITPWNFPLVLAMRVVAPAIALGNTVILKPAELTPVTGGFLLAELFADAGAPPDVLQVLTGLGPQAGEALVRHPGTTMIHFTGSSRVGQHIGSVAGGMLKKVSLELGGNNAFVVLDDANVEAASMVGAWSSFHYSGQACISASRHIVAASVADAYIAALAARAKGIVVGNPLDDGVNLGPMISETQRDRGLDLVKRSVDQGAELVEGGTFDRLFVRPTVLSGVTPEMPVYLEEVFAPVAPVIVVDSDEEALRLTNDSSYGLVHSVFTGDQARGLAFAEQVRAGMVHVNDTTCLDEAHVPFGGFGLSGSGGRAGGASNLDEFTERRWIGLQRTPVAYPY
ncbi:MAG: benzaldehyde dehydrogenase [Amycolatopsis sp.]|jgi:benzaldehyde dehydrogenase (NAD)|uniref:aldehyde dehydrogenase family protein n=1 Tax=Amycolatopsis sp. TaxID=37632 RepID=UPI0026315C9E|nr:aldehyde dehydrogenase family protein [Amycolatopsis sp.]MCU1687543.1 benzaldehyde dehydrogenase [Amycolatopsis sp.]